MATRRLTERDLADIKAARDAGPPAPGVEGRGRRLRKAARLTVAEVARAISTPGMPVTRSAVGMWELGKRQPTGDRALFYGRQLRQLEQGAGKADACQG